ERLRLPRPIDARRSFSAMPRQLPPELVYLVIDHVSEHSLALCARVCRLWHYASVRRVFGNITLRNRDFDEFTALASQSSLSLPDMIHDVTLQLDRDRELPHGHLQLIQQMQQVFTLTLLMHEDSMLRYMSTLSSTFPSIRTLRVHAYYVHSMRDILPLIASFPSLANLEIVHVPHGFFSRHPFPGEQAFPQLDSVLVTDEMDGFFAQIVRLRQIPAFSTVVWPGFVAWPTADSGFARYLEMMGPSVRCLHLVTVFGNRFLGDTESSLLRQCTSLRSIQISCFTDSGAEVVTILSEMIDNLHGPTLAAIHLDSPYGFSASRKAHLNGLAILNTHADIWNAIDRRIGDPKHFPVFRSLWIKTGLNPLLERTLVSYMPLSSARGLLEID
ncbi:unnamed protein product, partial [Mycena citricolor]